MAGVGVTHRVLAGGPRRHALDRHAARRPPRPGRDRTAALGAARARGHARRRRLRDHADHDEVGSSGSSPSARPPDAREPPVGLHHARGRAGDDRVRRARRSSRRCWRRRPRARRSSRRSSRRRARRTRRCRRSASGPFVREALPRDRLVGSSKRWLPSVTKQPLANMQWLPISTSSTAATITPRFRNVPDPMRIRAVAGRRDPDAGLEQRVLADLEPALAKRLEHVAVHGPAAERAPPRELAVDPRAVPRQRVALVPAPLLPPELCVAHRR